MDHTDGAPWGATTSITQLGILHHFKIELYFLPNKSSLFLQKNCSFLFKMWMKLPNLDEKVHKYN